MHDVSDYRFDYSPLGLSAHRSFKQYRRGLSWIQVPPAPSAPAAGTGTELASWIAFIAPVRTKWPDLLRIKDRSCSTSWWSRLAVNRPEFLPIGFPVRRSPVGLIRGQRSRPARSRSGCACRVRRGGARSHAHQRRLHRCWKRHEAHSAGHRRRPPLAIGENAASQTLRHPGPEPRGRIRIARDRALSWSFSAEWPPPRPRPVPGSCRHRARADHAPRAPRATPGLPPNHRSQG